MSRGTSVQPFEIHIPVAELAAACARLAATRGFDDVFADDPRYGAPASLVRRQPIAGYVTAPTAVALFREEFMRISRAWGGAAFQHPAMEFVRARRQVPRGRGG
jgi:hypothetical protein